MYYECNKCGQAISSSKDGMCTTVAVYRVSGICGGSFSKEISDDNTKWKEVIKKNKLK